MLSDAEMDELERQFPEMAQAAFAEAFRRALAAGHSVLVSEGGYLVEVFPDGRRKLIKQIEPPTTVVAGSRFTISYRP